MRPSLVLVSLTNHYPLFLFDFSSGFWIWRNSWNVWFFYFLQFNLRILSHIRTFFYLLLYFRVYRDIFFYFLFILFKFHIWIILKEVLSFCVSENLLFLNFLNFFNFFFSTLLIKQWKFNCFLNHSCFFLFSSLFSFFFKLCNSLSYLKFLSI